MASICVISSILLIMLIINLTLAQLDSTSPCTITPRLSGLNLNDISKQNLTISCACESSESLLLQLRVEDREFTSSVASIEPKAANLTCSNKTVTLTSELTATFLGFADLVIDRFDLSTGQQQLPAFREKFSVIRTERPVDTIFIVTVAVLVALNTINMGIQIDLEVVKRTLRRPLAPFIGLVCQFVFMPLASFGVGQLLLHTNYYRIGLFCLGCSPGGGASNFWTFLFDGDLDLSVTMTFISTVAALGMMPLWLFSLGSVLFETSDSASINIPYKNIGTYLCALVVPIAIGVFIAKKRPNWVQASRQCIRPITVFLLLFIFTFGVWANIFMFYILTWQMIVCGLLVAWSGYAVGAIAAKLAKQPREKIIAIAIETGVQNTGISIVLLRLSLPQPQADLSSVLPVAGSIMVFIPLFLCWCKKTIRERCCEKAEALDPADMSDTSSTLLEKTIKQNLTLDGDGITKQGGQNANGMTGQEKVTSNGKCPLGV